MRWVGSPSPHSAYWHILRPVTLKYSSRFCEVDWPPWRKRTERSGGHSIADEQIKFGYAVTGLIHPDKIWKNVGAKPGDLLVLTKALGSGVISTALKRDKAQESWVNAATQTMASLNRPAADVLRQVDGVEGRPSPVRAATDVTGFGLIGHAKEMASGSGVSLRIDHQQIEYLPGAVEAA